MTYGNQPSWYRQKELKKKYNETEVPSINELNQIIENIHFGIINPERDTLRARALIVLYYLTACRCSEIVSPKVLFKRKTIKESEIFIKIGKDVIKNYMDYKGREVCIWKVKEDNLGIKKEDIHFESIDNKEAMLIRTLNRKNRNRTTKNQPIPISLELCLVKHLKSYLDTLKEPTSVLFAFGTKRAVQIINKTLGFNVHFLRHIRATHLITLYDFNEQSLVEFMGWTDARPAKHYMELSKRDLFRQFYKNK